jgi:hypothetical protein
VEINRWTFELQRVVGELLEGLIEVATRLLVLPREVVALPHIGPAITAARFLSASLEAIVVGVTRLLNAE